MSSSTISTSALPVATLGTPRIGPRRELKFALESFWSGATDERALIETGAGLRAANWARQKKLGVSVIPSNDFSFYDQVLDTSVMVGAIPEIYRWDGGPVPLATYFAMARGAQGETHEADCGHAHHGHDTAHGVPAQEMTKWFDTNYHYMVPELAKDQKFSLASRKPIEEYEEALALGYQTRPVLVGPVTFLKLAKSKDAGFNTLSLLDRLLPVYIEVLRELVYRGAEWVQIDEPCLVLDLDIVGQQALHYAYTEIAKAVPQLKIMLATYFGGLGGNRETALALPVAGLHLDLVRAPDQIDDLEGFPKDRVLSLGVIDGRNIWRADLSRVLDRLEPVVARLGKDRVQIAPSCSLLHVPIDLALETGLDPEVKSWLAFSVQKIEELTALGTALAGGRGSAAASLKDSDKVAATRKASPRIHDAKVAARIAGIDDAMRRRASVFAERVGVQHARFNLPAFPTTTIGSFPQTADVRKARAAHAKGALTDDAYKSYLQDQTAQTVRWQEEIGLDVLVHGEFERNDMVQYFGEQLAGFAFTANGWVQSYGSRYVRPPVLFGDVSRPKPDDGRVVAIRPVADEEADEGDADRSRHHPELVVRPRRHSAQRGLPADCAGDPRRGRGSRSGRRGHDPDRRGGAAGGPAAAKIRMEGLSRLGRRGFPPLFVRRARRDADPHPYVLLGVQRHHRRHRRDGRRCDLDRNLALEDGIARCVQGLSLPERNRPRRL